MIHSGRVQLSWHIDVQKNKVFVHSGRNGKDRSVEANAFQKGSSDSVFNPFPPSQIKIIEQ